MIESEFSTPTVSGGHFTRKIVFVSQGGGIADSINIVARSYPNGDPHFFFDFGTCGF